MDSVIVESDILSAGTVVEMQLSDSALYLQNWIWRAMECLVESPEFDPSPKWAARRLNVSVEKVVDALEGLERLGFVKKDGKTYIKCIKEYHYGPREIPSEELLHVHKRLTQQTLTKMTTRSKFSNWFFLSDDQILSKYSPLFIDLYKRMHKEGLEKGCTQVVASEICFATLTDNGEAGGVQ